MAEDAINDGSLHCNSEDSSNSQTYNEEELKCNMLIKTQVPIKNNEVDSDCHLNLKTVMDKATADQQSSMEVIETNVATASTVYETSLQDQSNDAVVCNSATPSEVIIDSIIYDGSHQILDHSAHQIKTGTTKCDASIDVNPVQVCYSSETCEENIENSDSNISGIDQCISKEVNELSINPASFTTVLPSLGILVEDGNKTADSSCIQLEDKNIKENDRIKKVSAKVSMEPHRDCLEAEQPPAAPDSIKSVLKDSDLSDKPLLDVSSTEDSCPQEVNLNLSTTEKIENESSHELEGKPMEVHSSNSMLQEVSSPSEILHKVKRIKFGGKEVPIITQNNNGPCPLLAILNALLLRGEVELGVSGNTVTGGHLVGVVANALIDLASADNAAPQQQHLVHRNTDDAVQMLHKLLTGLDVNVRFSGVQDFEFTNELCVFDGLHINLYHGWVVDPEWPAAELVQHLTYNQLTNNIITWRHQATDTQDDMLIMKAVLCEEFLCASGSQLTVHGLFSLGSAMTEGEVAVLFRNNHFSTIYKHKEQLYQLLTDQGFLTEAATWQTLSDVDASFSEFVTASFEPLQPQQQQATGDCIMSTQQQITADCELAAVLQEESDRHCDSERSFVDTLQQLGCSSDMTDEEIARRLQDEEVRAAAADQEQRGATGGAMPPTAAPSPQQPQSPPALTRQRRKKEQCCIL